MSFYVFFFKFYLVSEIHFNIPLPGATHKYTITNKSNFQSKTKIFSTAYIRARASADTVLKPTIVHPD